MSRLVRISEDVSGLSARFMLLDQQAPHHARMLWRIAEQNADYHAIHAMWTGPEISCPIGKADLPPDTPETLPLENATSFPDSGEIATVFAPAGLWKGAPPYDFFDVGIFYDAGARLLMPMGWIMGSVSARVLPEDFQHLQQACRVIRSNGACRLRITTEV